MKVYIVICDYPKVVFDSLEKVANFIKEEWPQAGQLRRLYPHTWSALIYPDNIVDTVDVYEMEVG